MIGRPPLTRARLLGYVSKHWPCPIRQICRATGAERSYVKRVLRQEKIDTDRLLPPSQGGNCAVTGSSMTGLAYEPFLVKGTEHGSTNDELEQRQAIRQMCRYIADDAKIARHHMVSVERVQQIRAGMAKAKIRGLGVDRPRGHGSSLNATGANAVNPFTAENRMNEMIRQGSDLLRDALLRALSERRMVG